MPTLKRSGVARRRRADALILGIASAVPPLGWGMSFNSGGDVWISGLDRHPLPTLCVARWLGWECLTCGVTRSVIALMHGDWRASLASHRFGWLIFALIVAQVPYRAYRIARPARRLPAVERLGFAALAATAVLVISGRVFEAFGR